MLQGPTPVNADKMRLIEKKYLTERLINKVGNPFLNMLTNLDPFLKARECDIDWVRTLMVKKNTNKPGSYVATYLYLDDYNKPKSYTKSITYLAVVNENGNIKIDSVW